MLGLQRCACAARASAVVPPAIGGFLATVAVAATGMSRDEESRLFRFTFKHSVLLLVAIGILSMLYAHVFTGMVPVAPPR